MGEYKLIAYIGEEHREQGCTEMEYNPYEDAVIFRDSNNEEIWLSPDCLGEMAEQIKDFAEKLEKIKNPQTQGRR